MIALHNGKLVLAALILEEACLGLLEIAHAEHYELITLFYGAQVSTQEANRIGDLIRRQYPNHEIEIKMAGSRITISLFRSNNLYSNERCQETT